MIITNYYFNFIFFLQIRHSNFDFDRCSMYTNVIFSFEKCLNGQNHSSSDSNHPIKDLPKEGFLAPLNAIWKIMALLR